MQNANGLSTANYDATLIAWASGIVEPNININFGDSTYSPGAATATRQHLIDTDGWTITDGGED